MLLTPYTADVGLLFNLGLVPIELFKDIFGSLY